MSMDCLVAELETTRQVNSSAVIALSASVANFAWAISSDCSATGLAADGNRYLLSKPYVIRKDRLSRELSTANDLVPKLRQQAQQARCWHGISEGRSEET